LIGVDPAHQRAKRQEGDPMRRWLTATGVVLGVSLATVAPAFACGGLIGPNGAVRLLRTTTLAAWHAGYEHYVTSFQFEGGGAAFGSIVPLPAVPTKIEKGGSWTLQRLEREVQPPALAEEKASAGVDNAAAAVVVEQTQIDALELTVLKGGGAAVGEWAKQNGFLLTPDAPEILDYYARQSPYFLAAKFDAAAAQARGQQSGDGTPIQLTIPLAAPWVPLRILGLGLAPTDPIQADIFLLTDQHPKLTLPEVGVEVRQSEQASSSLLTDLRTDRGMEWVPPNMWLTYLTIDGQTRQIQSDLKVAGASAARPAPPPTTVAPTTTTSTSTSTTTTSTVPPVLTASPQPLPTVPISHHRSIGWLVAIAAALLAVAAMTAGQLIRRRAARDHGSL
jgi:hypothetical protein